MKKYLPYIVIVLVLVGGLWALGSYVVSSSKNKVANETQNNNQNTTADPHAGHNMGSSQPVAQSHRSYNIQLTSNPNGIKPGQSTKVSYKITNDLGEVVKDFTVAHEKIMHFIVVRKDLQQFQHLHPDFNQSTGEFSVNVTFPADGPYRIFPDFTPTPENPQKLPVTVNYDLNIGDLGKYKPVPVVVDTDPQKIINSYFINYDFSGELKAQTPVTYSLQIEKDREEVNLETYLGALGHSVILREGTLDFIHTHAEGMEMEGMGEMMMNHAGIEFATSFPEPGVYRIFTQFKNKGQVQTTDYTIRVN